MNKVPLSVIIPTFNEERNIEDCLKTVLWADELIVVDGGSQDRTREIAATLTPHILDTENAPAEIQRLKGIRTVHHEWFFLLDADERVSKTLRDQIEGVINAPYAKPAYYVLRQNLYQNRPVHLHRPDYHLRLFQRNEASSLPDRIHRIPKIRGKLGVLKGALFHHFFPSVEDYLGKLSRYTEIEAAYWKEDGRRMGGWRAPYFLLLHPAGRFFQYYFLKKGFLDGFFGFFYSASSAFYEIIVAARRLLEKEGVGSGEKPDELANISRQDLT